MLRKRFCELFLIDAPVLQAAICPATITWLYGASCPRGNSRSRPITPSS
jgi:hypothetical protein